MLTTHKRQNVPATCQIQFLFLLPIDSVSHITAYARRYKILLADSPCFADFMLAWRVYRRATIEVCRAIVVGKLCHTSSAWRGFVMRDRL